MPAQFLYALWRDMVLNDPDTGCLGCVIEFLYALWRDMVLNIVESSFAEGETGFYTPFGVTWF